MISLPCCRISLWSQGPGIPEGRSYQQKVRWRWHRVPWPFPCSFHHVLCPIQHQAYIFPSFPFAADISAESLKSRLWSCFFPSPSFQDPVLYHLMVTAVKTTPDICIPDQSFLVCKHEVCQYIKVCQCVGKWEIAMWGSSGIRFISWLWSEKIEN